MNVENKDRNENQGIDKPLADVKGYPDVFDDFDCRPENSYPEADRDDVIPDDIKREIEARNKAKGGNQAGADNADATYKE
jgi:hypothetical protein